MIEIAVKFLGRCGATEEELSARLAQVEAELAAVRIK